MTKNYEKFTYMKQVVETELCISYAWYLMDKHKARQGVHFHGVVYNRDKNLGFQNKHGFMAHGIESHSQKPHSEYDTPLKNCIVTCGDCYCDGSSLQASERLGWINPDGSDDEAIWEVLHGYYDAWITPIPNQGVEK
jgi:hypothetical protein